MKRIKFICITGSPESKIKWKTIPAATTKIDYLISALNRVDYAVDVISAANAEGPQLAWSRSKTVSFGVNTITTFRTISLPSKRVTRRLSTGMVMTAFKKYIVDNISNGDIVIAYHSPRYAGILSELRKSRNFTLIGEIEEIYQDVRSMGEKLDQEEYNFFEACDKYIFPTQLLNDKLNPSNIKKNIIIHGLYNVEHDRGQSFNDDKVHVVYAGTFNPKKGGAAAAAAAAAYLPENYHIHICGFGSEEQIEAIRNTVAETNKTAKAIVSYDGLLKGEAFIRFIQKCEIGLSTQNPNAAFNATSFPSKILTYLSNGLKVVTIDIPAIRISAVGKHLFYYQEQTPKNIAKAIVEAHANMGFNGRSLLEDLDRRFTSDLETFLL